MFHKNIAKDWPVFSKKARYIPGPFHTQEMDLRLVLVLEKWT